MNFFSIIGYVSVVLWLLVPVLWFMYFKKRGGTVTGLQRGLCLVALGVAFAAPIFAEVNSVTHGNQIQVDEGGKDSADLKYMEDKPQIQYQAFTNAPTGQLGKCNGDTTGWPEGMDDYKIRFIRLQHSGVGWDDGMDASGADINFLRAFARNTGFKKIAFKGESHKISLLAKYPKDGFPPFVFLTGNGSMGSVSASDRKILREYCLKGGMLIADAGSPEFHRSFTNFIQSVFPDKQLLDITDDDVLYQLPYGFPKGAPAFWHHGGRRALGMKHENRWIVFYHPGDMNDAWKSSGYTDVTPEMRDAAMQLGINLVYYAFNQWDDAVSKARK